MSKNPIVRIVTITFIASILLLSCNSTPPTQPQNDIRIISATAIGYTGNSAKILSGYPDESDPEGKKVVLLGSGQINASGEFTFEFKKSILEEKLYSPSQDSACNINFSNPVKTGTAPLSVVNSKNKLLGRLFLSSSKDLLGIGKTAEFIYVNQDVNVKGRCRHTIPNSNSNPLVINHKYQLKNGWNILITDKKAENLWEMYTSSDTSELKWYFLASD